MAQGRSDSVDSKRAEAEQQFLAEIQKLDAICSNAQHPANVAFKAVGAAGQRVMAALCLVYRSGSLTTAELNNLREVAEQISKIINSPVGIVAPLLEKLGTHPLCRQTIREPLIEFFAAAIATTIGIAVSTTAMLITAMPLVPFLQMPRVREVQRELDRITSEDRLRGGFSRPAIAPQLLPETADDQHSTTVSAAPAPSAEPRDDQEQGQRLGQVPRV